LTIENLAAGGGEPAAQRAAPFRYGVVFLLTVALVVFVIAAIIAGIIAAIFPARRAARLNVLAALQYE